VKSLSKLGIVALLGAGAAGLYAAPTGLGGDASPDLQASISRAQSVHAQALEDARHVQHLQQVARKEKDVIKLNCVNDKLVQIRPQLNMADRATGELNGGQKDALTQVIESGTAIHKLREAADQCIGEPVLGDESTNSFTHPPINDPTGTNPWTTVFEPPAYASAVN
jgi:hypothetical protein